MGLRLGRNSRLFSALLGLHHCHSQQGVHTDSWEICSGVQRNHDECKLTVWNGESRVDMNFEYGKSKATHEIIFLGQIS
jgi:hypothetical protein